jgi:hypothetical protein
MLPSWGSPFKNGAAPYEVEGLRVSEFVTRRQSWVCFPAHPRFDGEAMSLTRRERLRSKINPL